MRIISVVALAVLSVCGANIGAQIVAAPPDSLEWRVWAFGRLGGASSAPVAVATSGGGVLISANGGIVASRGAVLGMIRASDSQQLFSGPAVRDNALLVGLRTRGNAAFLAGAMGIAHATPYRTGDSGTSTGSPQIGFAYDLSAHGNISVLGLVLAISGVVGPQRTSYVAVTIGPEFGWFGR